MSIDGAVVGQAEFFEHDGRPEHALRGFFSAANDFDGCLAADFFHDAFRGVVQTVVSLVGDDAGEVACDGAYVAVDGPLVVIQNDDEALCLLGNVVESFERDAVGESGVSGDGNDVLFASGEVAGDSHSKCCGEGGTGVARTIGVVLALSAEHEAVEPARLANGVESVEAAGKDFVDIRLMTDIENETVSGRVKNSVKSESKLDDTQIGAQVAAGLRKGLDEKGTDLTRENGHLVGVQSLEIGRRMDRLKQ